MQDSLPAGWLAFTGRESNPLDRDERFPSCYISFSLPGFILTLDGGEHDGRLTSAGVKVLSEVHRLMSVSGVGRLTVRNDVRSSPSAD